MIIAALFSYGASGQLFHAPWIEASPHFQLYAVTERSKKQAAQRYPNIISYDTIQDLLADPVIQLVVVNTPSHTHFDLARLALEAGKHVIVEKPFTATVAEAETLYELARMKGLHVFCYQNHSFSSDTKTLRRLLAMQEMAVPLEAHFRWDRYRPGLNPKTWKEESALPANGLLYDIGPHLIDMALSLFGPAAKVHKITKCFRDNSEVDDYFHLHLEYNSGLQVFLSSSLLAAGSQPAFVVHAKGGTFVKLRGDLQEKQLQQGMPVTETAFGKELEETAGTLTLRDGKAIRIHSDCGYFGEFFDCVAACLESGAPFHPQKDDILTQLRILSMPDGCFEL